MPFISRSVFRGSQSTLRISTFLTEFLLIPTSARILLTHLSWNLIFAIRLLSLKFLQHFIIITILLIVGICYCKYALGYFSLSFSSVYLLPVFRTAPTLYMLRLTVLIMLLFNLSVLQFPEAPLESSNSLLGSLKNVNITFKIIFRQYQSKTDFYYRKFSYTYTLVIITLKCDM
jgi:hypothetical protein